MGSAHTHTMNLFSTHTHNVHGQCTHIQCAFVVHTHTMYLGSTHHTFCLEMGVERGGWKSEKQVILSTEEFSQRRMYLKRMYVISPKRIVRSGKDIC